MDSPENEKVSVHIDSSEVRKELPEFDYTLPCPKCRRRTVSGFGLAGGGFGPYTFCDPCGIVVSKSSDEEA